MYAPLESVYLPHLAPQVPPQHFLHEKCLFPLTVPNGRSFIKIPQKKKTQLENDTRNYDRSSATASVERKTTSFDSFVQF